MKLLIIEDNRHLAHSIKQYLNKWFIVDIALTGEDGIQKASTANYGVIILDLGLPDQTGEEVCRVLRDMKIVTPILILTGSNEVQSRVQLLDCGADDYVTKPFNCAELRARVMALTRRSDHVYTQNVIEVQDVVIDTMRREVTRSGVEVPLRRKEFDILEYLVTNRGRAVTREMILNHVWEANKDSWNNTVDVHIKNLRDKIDRPFPTPLIKTAYGIGYMVDDISV